MTLRQTHTPGERLFVDYSGKKLGIVDPDTGEVRWAELFVAVPGASNLTYAEATWTQLPDWIGSHIRALRFIGGVPRVVVMDNLKSGVHKPDFFDPVLNPTDGEMAAHYGMAIIPARPRKPRDKAKVEAGVLLVQRWILELSPQHGSTANGTSPGWSSGGLAHQRQLAKIRRHINDLDGAIGSFQIR